MGIIIATEDDQLIYWNPAAREIHGFKMPEDSIVSLKEAQLSYELWTPDGCHLLELDEWPLKRMKRGETVRDLELRLRRLDQDWERIISYSGSMVETASGERLIFLSIYDLTEQRKAEAALRESEERFRNLAESLPHLVWTANADGTVDYYNSRVAQYSGFERKPDGTWAWQPVLHPDDVEATIIAWQSAMSNKQIYEVEQRVRMIDGSYRWHLSRAYPVRQHDGTIKWFGTATDIHEVKETQEQLHESEEKFRAVFEQAAIGMGRISFKDAKWIDVNEVLCKMLGYSVEEFRATPWPEITHPDDIDLELIPFRQMAANKLNSYSVEKRFLHKEGYYVWARLTLSLVRDAQGQPDYEIAIIEDISDRKRAEEALNQAREEAERRSAELTSYFESMAEGAVLIDASGKLTYLNAAGREILKIPDNAPTPGSLSDYNLRTLQGESMERHRAASYRALQGETIRDLKHIVITPDGKEIMVSASASPVRDSSGKVIGATTIFRDIKEAVEFERQQAKLLEKEQHISEVLQKALIPEADYHIPCCDLGIRYESAYAEARVGGDFYDIFEISENKIAILIGNVAGKGLEASIQVAAVRHTIRSYAFLDPRPGRVLTLANEALSRDSSTEITMVTAFFAVLDTSIGALTYANAGHEIPFIRRFYGEVEELNAEGLVFGVMPGYQYKEQSALLHDKDRVVTFTDGVTEARTNGSNIFGKEGVSSFLAATQNISAEEIAKDLLQAAKDFSGGKLKDDAAVVVFGLQRDGD